MSKLEKYILIVISFILVVFLASGTTYLIMDNKNKNNDNINNNDNVNQDNKEKEDVILSDGIKLKDIKKIGDKVTENFEIVLNGKKKDFLVEFKYEKDEQFNSEYIIGTFNNYVVELDYHPMEEGNKDALLTTSNIKNIFNVNDFKIIKGNDNKNYLLVISKGYVDNVAFIFNDNLENIATDIEDIYDRAINLQNEASKNGFMITTFYNTPCDDGLDKIWYKNAFNIKDKTDFALKIDNNKIYYLATIKRDDNTYHLEERAYTINNNKLSYTVLNDYSVTNICEQS